MKVPNLCTWLTLAPPAELVAGPTKIFCLDCIALVNLNCTKELPTTLNNLDHLKDLTYSCDILVYQA